MKLSEADLVASICKESFYEFVQEFWDTAVAATPILNWHIELLCRELQKVAERVFIERSKAYDLVINIPPGTTKSTICSQMFPAWVWTRMPEARFICVSYAKDVALKDSLKTRDIITSEKYQASFPMTLREDENTKGLFTNTAKGSRYSAGIGGAVTGFHGHFLIVDDPLNPEEAYSEAELKVANRWMETTLPSRKVDKQVTPTILIQQRLHQSDPSGELLKNAKDTIRHICLPAELSEKVSPPELAVNYVDGLLDPVRMPRTVLKEFEMKMGVYGYAGQFMQDPVPLGGGMFEVANLCVVDELPDRQVREVRSWDKAGTEGGGAFSVGLRMGVDSRGRYGITDVARGQWGTSKREEMIRTLAEQDGDDIPIVLEVEGGSGGKESGESTVRNLAGYRVHLYHPTGDKVARAWGFASQVGARNVYVLDRPWTKAFIEELRHFPNSTFKDQVDAGSAGFNYLARKKRRVGGL